MATGKVRLTLEVSTDLNTTLDDLASSSGSNKSVVLRKAIALMEAASLAKKKGHELAFIDSKNDKVVSRIVGL